MIQKTTLIHRINDVETLSYADKHHNSEYTFLCLLIL